MYGQDHCYIRKERSDVELWLLVSPEMVEETRVSKGLDTNHQPLTCDMTYMYFVTLGHV